MKATPRAATACPKAAGQCAQLRLGCVQALLGEAIADLGILGGAAHGLQVGVQLEDGGQPGAISGLLEPALDLPAGARRGGDEVSFHHLADRGIEMLVDCKRREEGNV